MGRYNKGNLFNQNLKKIANQTVQFLKLLNCEKLVTLITITEATGALSNPIRQGTLTLALRICPNQFHTSAMKNAHLK